MRIIFLLTTFLTFSCVTTGRDFPSQFDWVEKNVTTQDDVRLVLGSPFAVGNSDGEGTWTFGFYKYQLFSKGSHKEVKIYWNADKTVSHFTFTSSFDADINAPAGRSSKNQPAQPLPRY